MALFQRALLPFLYFYRTVKYQMLSFFTIDTSSKADIQFPDVYFTPAYGRACEIAEGCEWELCKFKSLIYVYLKRPYVHRSNVYYDLVSPNGYAGIHYTDQTHLDEFVPLFRNEAKRRNYITEVIKQTPYKAININAHYDSLLSKKVFSIGDCSPGDYLKLLKSNTRKMHRKAIKLGYTCCISKLQPGENMQEFIELYHKTMRKVNAKDDYFYNDGYFSQMTRLGNVYLATVRCKENKARSMCIIFKHGDFIHYHLGCQDYSNNCLVEFMLISVFSFFPANTELILGGGLTDGDNLFKFKHKLSTKQYEYMMYKNILNTDVYDSIITDNKLDKESYFPAHRR